MSRDNQRKRMARVSLPIYQGTRADLRPTRNSDEPNVDGRARRFDSNTVKLKTEHYGKHKYGARPIMTPGLGFSLVSMQHASGC